jgi:hypothetical protein
MGAGMPMLGPGLLAEVPTPCHSTTPFAIPRRAGKSLRRKPRYTEEMEADCPDFKGRQTDASHSRRRGDRRSISKNKTLKFGSILPDAAGA